MITSASNNVANPWTCNLVQMMQQVTLFPNNENPATRKTGTGSLTPRLIFLPRMKETPNYQWNCARHQH